jgi:hypothetical protein
MDIRDFSAWSREAKRKALMRRSEMYGASLLPHQTETTMRRSIDDLGLQMYEIDHEDAIARIEGLAKRRLEQMKERRRGAK